MASDTGNGDGTQDSGTYDPNQPISVLGGLPFPSQWSASGGSDAAAGNQPSVLGDALNPRPWTPADNSLNFFVDPETMKTIDFGDTDQPQSLQPDGGGFNGLTPYQPDPSLSGARPVSDEGLDFIKRYELNPKTQQVDLTIFPDSQQNQTFGYGHRLSADEQASLPGQLASMSPDEKQARADQYFANDVSQAQANVFNRLGSQGVASLSQPQYDALVADSFNAGGAPALGPNMAQDIRNGDLDAAGQQFNAYWAKNAQTGEWELPTGLVRRSLQQAQLFNNGDYNYVPTDAEINTIKANPGPIPRR